MSVIYNTIKKKQTKNYEKKVKKRKQTKQIKPINCQINCSFYQLKNNKNKQQQFYI